MPVSDAALREYWDKHYHQLLPLTAENVHRKKTQQDKLKEVKAREHGRRRRTRRSHSTSKNPKPTPNVFSKIRRDGSESLGHRDSEREAMFTRLGRKEKAYSIGCERTEAFLGSEDSGGGHLKSRSKKQKSSIEEDDLSQPCEDPEDHLKIFQAAAKVKRWAMPTWCHMFNSTLTGFTRKCIKDPVEIHHIKQREGESTEDFVQRFKSEIRHVKGAPKCMRISGFMHGITNPELIKHLHDNIPKSVDEMMRETTTFLRGEVAASNQVRKKTLLTWKQQETGRKQNFDKKGDFRNQQRSKRRRNRFTLLTKSPKEILALDKGKFKTPPPMSTSVEKRNNNKFCEFHGEVGHNTDECMHLKRKIKELIKVGKLSHVIKELKQGSGKDQSKAAKKGEVSEKDKALAILMVQPLQRVARQKGYTKLLPRSRNLVPTLKDEDGTKGPMIIEAEIGGHFIHHIYIDGGSASEILYKHCFSRLCQEVKNQMVPAIAPLISFSGEIIWPIGQISLSVKIGDTEHSTSTWMNFVMLRSPYPYNGILKRPEVRKIQAVPLIAHGMFKFPVPGGILTLRSIKIILLDCTMVSGPEAQPSANTRVTVERIKVAMHPEYPEQTVAIGVPRHIAKHWLNVREGCHLVRQKKRSQAPERNKAIQKEVEGLVEACIMKENARASYQRLVDKAFLKQIGRNLEVYMDDLVIKSRTKQEIIKDIEETFKTLKKINIKLNPKKCTFAVEEGMFLGYMVNTKGIQVCLDKVETVLSLPSPKCLKDVQRLNGKLASLNRFLAKLAEKSLPFFKTLKKCTKKSDFQWTTEAKAAFKQMKKLIAELPTLTVPMEKEEVIVYLAAAREAVSAVLMTEREAKQMPIYFVSHALQDGSGAGLILTNPEGTEFTYALRFEFNATNNEAKYKALIAGLKIAEQMGIKNLQTHVDSRLVANQVNGSYIAKEPDMIQYLEKVKMPTSNFKKFSIKQVPRSKNKKADALTEVLTVVEEERNTWMTPIYLYLTEETFPAEKKKARAV
ncbi:reverse transcriptase domain-containing protein [Tanacetum coccineum]